MAAMMQRKTNLFEKLAPIWALLGMGLHVGAMWYTFFIERDIMFQDSYHGWIKLLIWIAVTVVSTLSFAPNDVTAVVRHTMFYIVAAGLCLAALYLYVKNVFPNTVKYREAFVVPGRDLSDLKVLTQDDYGMFYVKYAIELSLWLCGTVAAFAAIKYKMSASGWINKRIG